MSIKAIIPAGVDAITLSTRLHQWDYGQQLEIECPNLPAVIEVHFACPGMTEAAVRPCVAVDGVAVVTIPDKCLEQTSPITAWVFEITETQGTTLKTITIPIEARTKPGTRGDVPEDFVDQYETLIAEVNEAVARLTAGDVLVEAARQASYAKEIATGPSPAQTIAAVAEYSDEYDGDIMHLAPTSDGQQDLGRSENRFRYVYTTDVNANKVIATEAKADKVIAGSFSTDGFQATTAWMKYAGEQIPGGILLIRPSATYEHGTTLLEISGSGDSASGIWYGELDGVICPFRVFAAHTSGSTYSLRMEVYLNGNWIVNPDDQNGFKYKTISRYPVG